MNCSSAKIVLEFEKNDYSFLYNLLVQCGEVETIKLDHC
jgi:hypothetical protein